QPLVFTYSNINELLQPKIITNALELQIKVKGGCTVSANLNYEPDDALLFANRLILRHRQSTSNTVVLSLTDIPMTATPISLFAQPSAGPSAKHYSFYYDLILNPIDQFVDDEQHTFSITFTMSDL